VRHLLPFEALLIMTSLCHLQTFTNIHLNWRFGQFPAVAVFAESDCYAPLSSH
jgi:hypothetical protein